ncbi:unnamed protein product [Eruca vesicaria subsp. sativa]|uniref:F-box domain-containing protein n=1 Tax=Eruca vesicaria subsp. sativa TaxID=29727 RepID=A0ABC8LM88_ERUVS|nr:unnamed protein product [Eruca vesicaria subsp. sativa]
MSNSNTIEPPEKHHPPPPPSLSSLPDDILLTCLALVPRSYHLSLSWVSRKLRALLRSPQLNKLRSKKSLYVCFHEKYNDSDSTFHWFTLNEETKTSTTTKEYRLVPNPTPFPSHKYGSLTVAVGSKVYFIGGPRGEPSRDLWILDTRSETMTQGPSMSVPREQFDAAVGVIDGKIYVIGGEGFLQVEVFDVKSETWELAGLENAGKSYRCGASVEGKVYIVEKDEIHVYNPREGEGERMVKMVTKRLSEGGRKYKLNDTVYCVCVVDDVLFAFFNWTGLMWFDTKRNVWRRLVGRNGKRLKKLSTFSVKEMAEHDGKLAVFYQCFKTEEDFTVSEVVQCAIVSLHRAGDRICGTIDWFGVVGTLPFSFRFLHCLAVSD